MGINEIGPVNESEFLVCSILLIGCSLVNFTIFGEMAVLITKYNLSETLFQDKLD